MEQQALFDKIDRTQDWFTPANQPVVFTPVDDFKCPSHNAIEPVDFFGPGNAGGFGYKDQGSPLRTLPRHSGRQPAVGSSHGSGLLRRS